MSLLGVQTFMYRLKTDRKLQALFKARTSEAFVEYDLSPEEIRALAEADIARLYQMGVHPLLLAPYSRYADVPRQRYIELLAPLKGTRLLES